MRLIDADALKKDIEENAIVLGGVQSIEVECAKALIDNTPTECEAYRSFCMAKQRPQGEWIDHSEDYGYVECPFCERLTSCEGKIDELRYCWNCGAEMRKGDNNDT